MTTYTLDEGTCQRCGKTVTRRPGDRWTDFYGRDRCRLDPGDGECDVREWHQIQLPQSPPLQLAMVTLFGRNAQGQPVVLLEQQVPAGMSYAAELDVPLEVTGWSITADAAPFGDRYQVLADLADLIIAGQGLPPFEVARKIIDAGWTPPRPGSPAQPEGGPA